MLMEIDPLPMRGSMVMMMVTISPSQRDVSPAEQLRRSPRLVLPRFGLKTVALCPESFLLIFFLGQNTPYSRRWAPEACQGAHTLATRLGARPVREEIISKLSGRDSAATRRNQSRALAELFCRGHFPPGGGNHRHRHHQRSYHREGANIHQHPHQHHLL